MRPSPRCFRLAPVIDALEIDAPSVRLTRRADGSLDIDDILARIAATPSSPEPARFAVHNIVEVRGGAVDVADASVDATHQVRGIELGIPFLSSLPSQRKVTVEPHLAFVLDGSRFDSRAAATPWAERGNRRGEHPLRALRHRPLARLPAEGAAGTAAGRAAERRPAHRLRAAAGTSR